MAIQIEILSFDKERRNIRAAFYYAVPVADRKTAANDQTREALGIRLSVAEKQALKDGALVEFIHSGKPPVNTSQAKMKTIMIADYAAKQGEALARYAKEYQVVGVAYDGSVWSTQ